MRSLNVAPSLRIAYRPSKQTNQTAVLRSFAGAEGGLLRSLDVDRLAGRRIATHASGALAHLQDAEAGDLHPLAPLQVLNDEAEELPASPERLTFASGEQSKLVLRSETG
jgi:hypothetical protein